MPLIQKAKRAARKAATRASFRPWLVTNANTLDKQLLWRGKIRGKKVVVKGSKTLEAHEEERKCRLLAIQNLDRLQGKKYELKISKRYPAPKGKRVEVYYDLPTRAELGDVYIDTVHAKVGRLSKRTGIAPQELYKKCEEAFKELLGKQRETNLKIDLWAGNLLIDANKEGKIVFTLIDF